MYVAICQNFWSVVTKFSKGKWLNQDHKDHYQNSNKLTFCRIGDGNIEQTHIQVFTSLALPITPPELKHQSVAEMKRKWNKEY